MNNKEADSEGSDPIILVGSTEERMLSLICNELDNEKSRTIINLVWEGCETASEIAGKVGLTSQAVNYHLRRLLSIRLIRVSGAWSELRGRGSRHYEPSKLAILIIPIDMKKNRARAMELIHEAATKRLRGVLASALVVALGLAGLTYLAYAQSNLSSQGAKFPYESLSWIVNLLPIVLPLAIGALTFWLALKLMKARWGFGNLKEFD
ncbi:MAG: winged helix-turn-helix domain-containing protein [Nitrososphaerales archaeon]|nr:winged helix-turn-helix domain-containing protein [Nitrososphaerales archaeon]